MAIAGSSRADANEDVARMRPPFEHFDADALVEFLKARTLLLLLDNCEHLFAGAASVTETILRSCRGVRILDTSREGLGADGERIWPLRSLLVPPPGAEMAMIARVAPWHF